MNFGKVSESIYKRTVYKTIHTTGYFDKETKNGAVLGSDCAFLAPVVTASGQAWGKDAAVATRAAHHAINHLAAMGALCDADEEKAIAYISFNICIPTEYREAKLRAALEKVTQTMAEMLVTVFSLYDKN
mgnify:CR=1 FL=1